MVRRIFDTSILISDWHQNAGKRPKRGSKRQFETWGNQRAKELIELHGSDLIATPVAIEFIAGVQSSDELRLARAFLKPFRVMDDGRILSEDWKEAERLAARVPSDGRRRQLGDCLIRAIADRLNCEVLSLDKGFPA